MANIELTESQEAFLVDALSTGIVEAIEYLTEACPELGDYIIRQLVADGFNKAVVFNTQKYAVGVDTTAIHNLISKFPESK